MNLLAKMKLMKKLRAFIAFGQCTYNEILIKEIQLVKEIFIMDLEQGDEIAIP